MKAYPIAALLGAVIAMIGACAAARSNDPPSGAGGDSTSTAVASGSSSGGGGAGPASASTATVTTGTGANPGSCMITCVNDAPNHEMGCDGCLKAACANEYAACAADKGDAGCVSCSTLLAQGGSGIDCDESVPLMTSLLECACSAGVCN